MTPEESFKRWLAKTKWLDKAGMDMIPEAWFEAWKQGHHQGMTRAAEICEENECEKITTAAENQWNYACEAIYEAILTERDKGNK